MDLKLDQFKDVNLVIDKANDVFIPRQFVSQGDYKGRTLTVQITNNGSIGEVPGLTLNLNWHNEASGLTDLTAFTILDKTNSIFRIEYPENMMTPGKVYASIQIIQDGKVTNLKQFELIVQKLAGQPVGIAQKAEFSALVAALADSNKFRTDIDSLSASKADKNYINDYLSKVTVVPETFANLAAIKDKYPTGKNGIMVAGDSGHKYLWNETDWIDAGVYQAVGVARESISPVQTTFTNSDGVDLTKGAKLIQGDLSQSTQQIQLSTSNRLLYAECKPNTKYYVAKDKGQTFAIAFAKEIPVKGTTYYQKEYFTGQKRVEATCPANCSYIYVWFWNKDADVGLDVDRVFNGIMITDSPYMFRLSNDVTITKDNLQPDVFKYIDRESAIKKSTVTGSAMTSVYAASVRNNLDITRDNEIIQIKVNFDDGEVLSPEMLKVKVDGSYVDFDWLGNINEMDDATLSQQQYPSGFLRAGTIVVATNIAALQEISVKIEVYAEQVTSFDPVGSVKSTMNTDGVGSLSTDNLKADIGGRIGYTISGLSYRGQNTFNGDYAERDGYVNENHEIPFFSSPTLLSYEIDGYGTVCRRLRYRYKTQIDGIEMAVTTVMFANDTIDVHKRYIFTKALKTYGLRNKIYFYSDSFISDALPRTANEVVNSVGGSMAGVNPVLSLITTQVIPNGGADFFGDKGPQQFEGTVGFSIGANNVGTFSASIDEYADGQAVTVGAGDSFGFHFVYNLSDDSLSNNQLKNFNPIFAQATKTLKTAQLRNIKEKLTDYIVNNYDIAVGVTGFKGYVVLNKIAYATLTDSIDHMLDEINTAFDDYVSYYGDADNMFTLFKNGRGVEFTGRDSVALGGIIRFFEEQNDTTRLAQANQMMLEFVDYFCKIEQYSGGNGAIKLGYNGVDTLNSESAALAVMQYADNNDQLTAEQKIVFDRINERFLSLIQKRNILPYSPTFNITWQYKFHYHLFSLFNYVLFSNGQISELDTMSYINQLSTANGKFYEFDANYQSSRRATPHGSMYCVAIALKKGDISSLATADSILDNLLKNCYADGSFNYPIDSWESSESEVNIINQNTAIACAAASEILAEFYW